MQQKSPKTDKNKGGKQKTQWDSNSGEVEVEMEVGGMVGERRLGRREAAILGSHILKTYLQQKGQGVVLSVCGGVLWWLLQSVEVRFWVGFICIDPQDSDHEQL